MSVRPVCDRGYVLHSRPYRESSALVDLFSHDHGRIAAVARGVRGAGKRVRTVQPFVALALTWDGGGELRNLRAWESERALWLTGDALATGLYLNELLIRLLPREDPHQVLFGAYHQLLPQLLEGGFEPGLRRFERLLLDELGYGTTFSHAGDDGAPVIATRQYRLVDLAFIASDAGQYAGAELLAIDADDYSLLATRRAAKRIFRALLAAQLGPKPLLSRQMFSRQMFSPRRPPVAGESVRDE